MRSPIFLLLLLVLLALCACESENKERIQEKQTPVLEFAGDRVSIPIRFLHNRPVIDVKINGQGPFTLMLDTGAVNISLEKSVVKHLQLPDCGTSTLTNAASEKHEVRNVGVDRIEIGDAVLEKIGVHESDYFWRAGMPGIQGIWGMARFGKRIVTVDYHQNMLHIRKQRAESSEDTPWLPMRMDDVETYVPEVPIQIGGRVYHFLIDTGSDEGLSVAASVASELPLYKKRFRSRAGVSGGKEGVSLVWRSSTRLREVIRLGSHDVERPYVNWVEGRPGRNLLGMAILRHFAIELDLKGKRVRFLREEESPLSVPDKKRLGVWIDRNSDDNSSVISGLTSFRATMDDVKVGDRVITINGHAPENMPEGFFQKMKNTKDSLTFIVQRNGENLTIEVDWLQDSFGPAP